MVLFFSYDFQISTSCFAWLKLKSGANLGRITCSDETQENTKAAPETLTLHHGACPIHLQDADVGTHSRRLLWWLLITLWCYLFQDRSEDRHSCAANLMFPVSIIFKRPPPGPSFFFFYPKEEGWRDLIILSKESLREAWEKFYFSSS